MKSMLIIPATILAIAASTAAASAGSWSHKGTATGPNGGTISHQGGGSSTATGSAGSWSRSGTATGPNGGTVTHKGGGACNAYGCVRGGTVTGPQGNTVVRGRAVRVY